MSKKEITFEELQDSRRRSMKLIVYHKSNGLIADEFIYSDEIQITEHIKKFVGDTKNKDCFLLKFPSGNYCFYANSDYYYKIKEL